MKTEPNSILRRNLKPPFNWFVGCVILVVLFFLGLAIAGLAFGAVDLPYSLKWLLAVAFALLAVFLLGFLRWINSWLHFKRFLFGAACLGTLIALFYAEEDWRGWHAWSQFKQTWEAKGEHFEFSSVVPPPVPDDQNFAMTPIVFTSYGFTLNREGRKISYNTNFDERMDISVVHGYESAPAGGIGNREKEKFSNLAVWQSYYRHLAKKTNEFSVPAKSGSPSADVLLALSKYDGVIVELRQACQLPDSRFPLNYGSEEPFAILLPHLSPVRNCGRVLQLRSLAELQNSQPEQALGDILLELQLSDKIQTEPFLISHLVRIALVQSALQPIWEGLAEHKWTDAQLARLDVELAKLDFLADYQQSMRGELGMQCGTFEFLRQHRCEFFNMIGSTGHQSDGSPLIELIPSGWFYQNQLRCARIMVEYYIPLANVDQRTLSPEAARRAGETVESEVKNITPYNLLERLLLPSLSMAPRKFAYAQSSVDLARMAIALERYRLAHGEYPDTLNSLVPKFITQVAHDIINGQPLHYRRTDDGLFALYSVGWNETDDGGVVAYFPRSKPPRVDTSKGDWIWRYPGK